MRRGTQAETSQTQRIQLLARKWVHDGWEWAPEPVRRSEHRHHHVALLRQLAQRVGLLQTCGREKVCSQLSSQLAQESNTQVAGLAWCGGVPLGAPGPRHTRIEWPAAAARCAKSAANASVATSPIVPPVDASDAGNTV
jgi:hypothetical protein